MTFCCVSYYSGAFGTLWLPYSTQCKTGRSGAKVRAMKSCRNFSQRTDPIHPFGHLPHVSVRFVLFGCIWDSLFTTLSSKRAKLVQKFVPRSRVRIFRNERTRSTPFDPKLTFRCVSYYLGSFGTVWLPYKTRCKTAELVQKFVPRSRVGIFRNKCT